MREREPLSQLREEAAGGMPRTVSSLPLDRSAMDAPMHLISGDAPFGTAALQVQIPGYRHVAQIGEGGQGVVYRGVQETTGRTVAIKVLNGGQHAISASRVRFEREITLLAKLNHPNIVSIIDCGRTAEGAFYLVMELVDGLPLHEYLAQHQPLDIPEVVQICIKITQALAEAHRQGIVHRDLKPQNIRVDRHGEPHLLDFGLARSISEQGSVGVASPTVTLPNQIMGSIPWSSPEQINGGLIDHRSDIYALGFILYYLLRGSCPFPVRNLPESIENIAHARPAPLNSGYPALDVVVMRCIEKKPANRYQSAEELLRELEKVANSRGVTWTYYAGQWALRAGAVAALTVLVLLLWYGISSVIRQTPTPRSPSTVTNSIGMEFLLIRHGFFLMGSPLKEAGRQNDEIQHPVELTKDFYLARTEVTQRQYREVMGNSTATTQPAADDYPVGGISWEDAQEFCRRLSLKEKHNYRLPTEAEWEYACRAGTRDAFGSTHPEDTGWFALNSLNPQPAVATKRPNAWGLYDMHGGVSEWCQDGYMPYPNTTIQDPVVDINTSKVIRGGHYFLSPEKCRAASRQLVNPSAHEPQMGFRVARDVR